ncbi:MAG: prepilin-type N-terminal cleavage/methylation domain-containing protein [Candidatus Omnitrophica bacterium]|nr:prepilin-type N-terminal cleavage/methylation domain-containing protein [Candidatus Omnitrophota bacterium]
MTSPTGSDKKGFTLIELMVAVAILSFGLVMIYEAFFSYMDAYNYVFRRLEAQRWIEEKVWQTENELVISGMLMPGDMSGSFIRSNKKFSWNMSIRLIGEIEESSLYELTLEVSWQEVTRDAKISQVAYVQS